jgi:hypothetical protein
MQTQFLDSELKDLSTYQIEVKKSSYERNIIFLKHPINSVNIKVIMKKQVQLTSKASKPTWQLFLHMEKVFNWEC